MNTKTLDGFPPGSNPFNHDLYHMGTEIGKNVIVMFANHPTEMCDYLIVVNRETGERLQINFTEAGAKQADKNEAIGTLLQAVPAPKLPPEYKIDLEGRWKQFQEDLKELKPKK